MEIRFTPKEHLDLLNSEGVDSIPQKYLDDLFADITNKDTPPKFKTVDYAAGADYIWIYAFIAGVIHVIALGGQINSGFEGWAQLADKLTKLIKNTRDIALDKDAISALCVNIILETEADIDSIKKVIEFETETPAAYDYGGTCEHSEFLEKANIYYIQGYEINSKVFILFGAHQGGEIEILKKINIVKYR